MKHCRDKDIEKLINTLVVEENDSNVGKYAIFKKLDSRGLMHKTSVFQIYCKQKLYSNEIGYRVKTVWGPHHTEGSPCTYACSLDELELIDTIEEGIKKLK